MNTIAALRCCWTEGLNFSCDKLIDQKMTFIKRIRDSIGIKLSDNKGIMEILNTNTAKNITEIIERYSPMYIRTDVILLRKSTVNMLAILFWINKNEVKTDPPTRKNIIPVVDKSNIGTKK